MEVPQADRMKQIMGEFSREVRLFSLMNSGVQLFLLDLTFCFCWEVLLCLHGPGIYSVTRSANLVSCFAFLKGENRREAALLPQAAQSCGQATGAPFKCAPQIGASCARFLGSARASGQSSTPAAVWFLDSSLLQRLKCWYFVCSLAETACALTDDGLGLVPNPSAVNILTTFCGSI